MALNISRRDGSKPVLRVLRVENGSGVQYFGEPHLHLPLSQGGRLALYLAFTRVLLSSSRSTPHPTGLSEPSLDSLLLKDEQVPTGRPRFGAPAWRKGVQGSSFSALTSPHSPKSG